MEKFGYLDMNDKLYFQKRPWIILFIQGLFLNYSDHYIIFYVFSQATFPPANPKPARQKKYYYRHRDEL